MNIWSDFPAPGPLLERNTPRKTCFVNGHFHTPYSFSAFDNIAQIIRMAVEENVRVLGINDFYTTAGYDEFYSLSLKNNIFPLFNIEFIGLSKDLQAKGIRVNDPNNPGRTYFSGKGLDYPVSWRSETLNLIEQVRNGNSKQIASMIDLLNGLLSNIKAGFSFSYDEIKKMYALDLVRERHIAKALRVKIMENFNTDTGRLRFLQELYGGKTPLASLDDIPALEEEIRANLLKAGGPCFVAEDESAFLSIEQICRIILDGGGIPCYPVLLDDKNGKYTDYESDPQTMMNDLKSKNIYAVELIPGRNAADKLKDFMLYFYHRGFIVLLGTEHNTPLLFPLTVKCRNNVSLDEEMQTIAYEGACVVAAHQYLRARGEKGFTQNYSNRDQLAQLGHEVINEYFLKKEK